ncbi:putative Type 1 protein exporter [Helianthus debilis subsp. tardiflorus]
MALFTRQFLTNINMAVLYWYGGKLLYNGDISYKHLFQTFYVVVTAGILIAEAGSMTGYISIEAGEVAALVGISGSGTSRIIGMIQRFYDPVGGSVKIDGLY